MNIENENNLKYWNNLHKNYHRDDIKYDYWLEKFNDTISESKGPIIDLGCGSGNNTLYMINKGKSVIPCDGSINAIHNIRNNFPEVKDSICFDMLDIFPFANNSTDLLIADLSLHYFKKEDTIKILNEIKRILVNRGHMIARVNSINDINHGSGDGIEIEPHLYLTSDGRYKRFFDNNDIEEIFNIFDITYVKEETMNRYKLIKKVKVLDLRNVK